MGPGRGVTLDFIRDDVDALAVELIACRLSVAPPKVAYHGMKQVFLPEPDGYQLCFGSPR